MATDRLPRRSGSKFIIPDCPELLEWVRRQRGFKDCPDVETLGIAIDGKVIAVFTYSNFRLPDIEIGLCGDDPRWVSRGVLRTVFKRVLDYGCNRATVTCHSDNKKMHRFLERLGFVKEGVKREAMDGGDEVIFGLLKNEFMLERK